MRAALRIATVACALATTALGAEASRPARASSCVEELLSRVTVSNPEAVCRIAGERRDPRARSNFAQRFDLRMEDLGDGTPVYVLEGRRNEDPYAYVPNFHFAKSGGALELVYDGKGVPSTYAKHRPKVNRRYQIERVLRADIPGLYRKREVETWFWNGSEYAKAFSRVTIEGASDAKLNGTRLVWNPVMKEAYQQVGEPWTYTVQPGDTLSGISRKKGVSTTEIARQNGIRNAGSLRVGQVLRYESWEAYSQ